jgi:hypothetical protein
MARKEQIDALLVQVGPVLDPLGIVAYDSENSWRIQVTEDVELILDFDEEQGKLTMSCDLGAPPAGDRGKLYELMLRNNYHWDATGGSRLAVDAPDGKVVLIFDVPTAELDVSKLSNALSRFADMARAWRHIVSQPSQSKSSPAESNSNSLEFPMLRI